MLLIYDNDFIFLIFFEKEKKTTQKPIASFMKPNDSLIFFFWKITRTSGSFYFYLILNTHNQHFFLVKKI